MVDPGYIKKFILYPAISWFLYMRTMKKHIVLRVILLPEMARKLIRQFFKISSPPPRHVCWKISACVNVGQGEGQASTDTGARTRAAQISYSHQWVSLLHFVQHLGRHAVYKYVLFGVRLKMPMVVTAPVENTHSLGYSWICQGGHHPCNRTFDLLPQPNLTLNWKTQYFVQIDPNSILRRLCHIGDIKDTGMKIFTF